MVLTFDFFFFLTNSNVLFWSMLLGNEINTLFKWLSLPCFEEYNIYIKLNGFTGDPITTICNRNLDFWDFFFPVQNLTLWVVNIRLTLASLGELSSASHTHMAKCVKPLLPIPSQTMAAVLTIKIGQESVMRCLRGLLSVKHISPFPGVQQQPQFLMVKIGYTVRMVTLYLTAGPLAEVLKHWS